MSRAPVVDQKYRLQPNDLQGMALRVVIEDVTFQGLEELVPVLHFADPPAKHLVLDAALRRELIAVTGSSLYDDWIGQTIELRPLQQREEMRIGLALPGQPKLSSGQTIHLQGRGRQQAAAYIRLLLLIVLFILILMVVSWLESSDPILQTTLDALR